MKKIIYRLLPVASLLCLPLFGGYNPVITRESLHLDGAQLEAITGKMAAQGARVTREYLFSFLETAPRNGPRDFGPLADYRFFSMLTNFRNVQIQAAIVARTTRGQDILTAQANSGQPLNPTYRESWTYNGYGRFYFDWGMTKVHNRYGRQPGEFPGQPDIPFTDETYMLFVREDMMVRATGEPSPDHPADPAGW